MAMRVKLDDIEMDATPEQDYSATVEATDHPVEGKFDPTDHARSKPETWSGTCVISNFPVNTDQQQARGTYFNGPLPKPSGTVRGSFESGKTGGYARNTFEKIRKMKDDHETHTLVTPLRSYDNMVIVSLSVATRSQHGDGVVFKISLKQISIVDAATGQFVTRPVTTNTKKPTTKTDQAKKQGAPAKKATAVKGITNATGWTEVGSGIAPQ